MQLKPIADDHEAEYWVGQIRLGAGIAVVLTALAVLRIVTHWGTERAGWIVVLGAAVVIQAVAAVLPWARWVRRPRVRRWLFLWWVSEVPLLTAYVAADPVAIVYYLPGVMLIILLASALYPYRAVLFLGVLAVAGFAAVIGSHPPAGPVMITGMATILVILIALCAITAVNRNRQDERRRAADRRTEALLENASDIVLSLHPDGAVSYASASVREVAGYEPGWLTGSRLGEMVHPDELVQAREWMANLFGSPAGHTAQIEVRLRRADGTWLYADVIGTNRTDDPHLRAAVLSIRDNTARRMLEEELTRQAFADSLTGLANRALFRDRVDHAVARHVRDGGLVTLLLIDLDDFKIVNDSLGHSAGDELLMAVADRLRRHVRPSDTLARLGGDEFAVLVEGLDQGEAQELAERILAAMREPVSVGVREVSCTMSIGIASNGGGARDTEGLLRDADLAMYAAKNNGRDGYAVFDPAMHAGVLEEAQRRADMERALSNDEFLLRYQPIVDLPGRRLIGVEALVRWQHPRDGLVAPNDFIPLAESTGLIVPLGRWVLRRACAQLARWQADRPRASAQLRMSVNLSARQFQYAGLVDDVASAIADAGVNPGNLVLEITESMLMRDTDATVATLRQLKELGVRLAIDDFGTGYSSLSYLKQFPVDILKIDRSFVDGVTRDSGDASLAEAVVQLGRALHLQTVAEGIETPDQWAALRGLGCDYGQGYLFARPVEADEIDVLLAAPPGVMAA